MDSGKISGKTAGGSAWQTAVLEGIARGVPLEQTLDGLARSIESEAKGFLCGICVLAPSASTIASHFGPALPEDYRRPAIGLSLAEGDAPYAVAARQRETVVVSDIAADPRWSGTAWGGRALAHGLRFCQCFPIVGSSGRVIGTLALYSAAPVQAAALPLSETAVHLASIAIERHNDETALRESEERLRFAVTGADLGTWDWNLTTGDLVWNERCKEMFGYPPETVMNYERFLAAIHPEDRGWVDQAVKDALEGRMAYDIEYRTVWPDGTVRWVSAIGSCFSEDGKGEPLFMRGIAMDVTSRKEAESLAAENLARFRFLAESLPEKIFTTDAAGEMTYLNRQWEAYTGLPLEEVQRMGWREFVHPDDLEEKMALWSHAMREGTPFEFEHRFRRGDGEYRWHLSRAHPMRRPDGVIGMWVGSNVDVDDLKRAQFALGESESRSRLAMEAAGLGFWDWDLGRRVTWSPEHNRMFGMDPEIREGTYDQAMAHVHPDDRRFVEEALDRALAGRTEYEAEFRTVGGDGAVRWVAAHGRAYYDEDGRPVRMIGMVREVTERKRFEEQLRAKQEELRSALAAAELARKEAEAGNAAKDQFLAVLSHELRTPLTPVLMTVSYLSRDNNLPQHAQEAMQMIQRNIKLEARLIEDLLDLTRISRNKMELHLESMDLHLAARQAVEICAADIEAKKHRLHLDLAAKNSRVSGDLARLQQVFWNLLKNAVKFTPEGGRIAIASRNKGARIVVEITDSGRGIPPAVLPRIFHPFEQGDLGFVREYGGLGLGLAIAKATIDGHRGVLQASSAGQNQGATFVVELATEKP